MGYKGVPNIPAGTLLRLQPGVAGTWYLIRVPVQVLGYNRTSIPVYSPVSGIRVRDWMPHALISVAVAFAHRTTFASRQAKTSCLCSKDILPSHHQTNSRPGVLACLPLRQQLQTAAGKAPHHQHDRRHTLALWVYRNVHEYKDCLIIKIITKRSLHLRPYWCTQRQAFQNRWMVSAKQHSLSHLSL